MNRLHLLKESLIAACLIVAATFLLIQIPLSNEFRKGLFQGFADFDVYDLHYSGKSKEPKTPDTNIVLVGIGNTRSDIATQIEIINRCQPRVIGVDVLFEEPKDSTGDRKLAAIVQIRSNIVLASRYTDSPPRFIANYFDPHGRRSGYVNFIGNKYSVSRTYTPFLSIEGNKYPSFTSAIIKKAYPDHYKKLVKRNKTQELIHYRGNTENYLSMSADELVHYDTTGQLSASLKNKVVLLGFFIKQDGANQQPLVLEDLHFSPLNETIVGKSFPDMYGVVVHANVLSMIIQKEYANLAPPKISYLLALLFTMLFTGYILYCYRRSPHPSHGKLMLLQFIGILLIIYVFLLLFDKFRYKVPLQPIIIPLVLSLEMLGLYKMIAVWLHKKFHFQTVFTHKHTP